MIARSSPPRSYRLTRRFTCLAHPAVLRSLVAPSLLRTAPLAPPAPRPTLSPPSPGWIPAIRTNPLST